jgi:hypothetical protein
MAVVRYGVGAMLVIGGGRYILLRERLRAIFAKEFVSNVYYSYVE